MTSLKDLATYDLSKLELLWSARMSGKSNLTNIYDALTVLSTKDCRSPLEAKMDKLINSYWTNGGSKELRAMLAAQKANPRTKDVFRSTSTPHTFPWYHRNRKY